MTASDAPSLDVGALEYELRRTTSAEVRFDAGSRATYATDASNYRQVPIGVVVPRTLDDVHATVAACREHGAPLLSRGGGTSLAGQCCNVAVVVDWSKYLHRVIEIDVEAKRARVEPGCVLDDLRAAASTHGLTFGPDPATHTHCTLGGMIGNNSCGVHSIMAGRTADNVESLRVLTYGGDEFVVGPVDEESWAARSTGEDRVGIVHRRLRQLRDRHAAEIRRRYPDIPRRVSGYNLDELLPEKANIARALVGTEGTCVTVLEAEVRLIDDPPARTLLVLGYPDIASAADDVPAVMDSGPIGLEGVDHKLFHYSEEKNLHPKSLDLMPDGRGWLLVEFGGASKAETDAQAARLVKALGRRRDGASHRIFDDPAQEKLVWEVRESGLGATARIPGGPDTWPGWEDSSVAPALAGAYLRDLGRLYDDFGYDGALYGHFGQGCIHSRISFDLQCAGGIGRFRAFMTEAASLVVSYGGSLSGEHGDGQARAELLPIMFGQDLVDAFGDFKSIWDPDDRMNPGKVVRPAAIDDNLRLGASYEPWHPVTFFGFPDDDGDLARAALRCVGVGKCRREEGGTMCPSYMVTREEQHSTRGRARLLFEMLQGEVIDDGWRSTEVRDALDLCLSCKGCKGDCPMHVDMATYKAEFLAHHYAGRLRPAAHYSMGWLPLTARAAAKVPGLVNRLTSSTVSAGVLKRIGGIASERDLPAFARSTWRQAFDARPPTSEGRDVVLWPDTFTNFFHPQVGEAATDALVTLGFRPRMAPSGLCCGLTWISTGQLKTAKRVLRRTMRALRDDIRRGSPILVLEPSCAAVFRSDLTDLFPHDEDARRLRHNTVTLSELLRDVDLDDARPPGRRALMQAHCHQRAVLGIESDLDLLERLGVDVELPESGCCGLAGNFGFERGHYDVSMACGERAILPAVRAASPDVAILADGFSCRTQITDATDRRPLHTAQLLAQSVGRGRSSSAP